LDEYDIKRIIMNKATKKVIDTTAILLGKVFISQFLN